MSATTPAIQRGIGTQRLGAVLAAIALAVIVVVAIVGLQAAASRTASSIPAAAPAPASQLDHGWATESRPVLSPVVLPRAFDPAQLPATPVGGGRGTRIAQ